MTKIATLARVVLLFVVCALVSTCGDTPSLITPGGRTIDGPEISLATPGSTIWNVNPNGQSMPWRVAMLMLQFPPGTLNEVRYTSGSYSLRVDVLAWTVGADGVRRSVLIEDENIVEVLHPLDNTMQQRRGASYVMIGTVDCAFGGSSLMVEVVITSGDAEFATAVPRVAMQEWK